MNYNYKNYKDNEIVKRFDKMDDKIVITFLDDSLVVLDLNDENEKDALDLLLKQAIERDKSDALENAISKRTIYLLIGILSSIGVDLTLRNFLSNPNIFLLALNTLLFLLNGSNVIKLGKKFENSYKEIEEIQKYRIYLQIKEELDGKKNGIKNINDLDKFSLNDVKNLQKTLVKKINFNK